MRLLGNLVVNILAILVVEYLVPGFSVNNLWTAFVASIVIGIVNTLIKPILQFIALPITILTLGLFAFVINVILLYLVSLIVPGFIIDSLLTAAIASIALSLVSWFLHKLAGE